MNINQEISEITINNEVYVKKSSIQQAESVDTSGMTWCIVRSRDQGVMFGLVDKPLEITSRCVTMYCARQIWAWNSDFVLVELSEKGPKRPADTQMSCAKTEGFRFTEACGIYVCSAIATAALKAVPSTVK